MTDETKWRDDIFDCFEDGVWQRLDDHARRTGLTGGTYLVHLIEAGASIRKDRFHLVPRLLKQDPLGRLYIGRAKDFRDRFIELRKSLHPEYKTNTHGFAKAALRHFTADRLALSVCFREDPIAAESRALSSYAYEFGELPPFNAVGAGDGLPVSGELGHR